MSISIELKEGQKAYFISDLHLGAAEARGCSSKERLLLDWLEEIEPDCGTLMLCGDVFDFWYEWREVVPKGYVRLFAKLARMKENGIYVYFFTGNHDMWVRDYFEKELGVDTFEDPVDFVINDKKFLVGHGDGLGPGDKKFKAMKAVFKNSVARWMFSNLVHPDWAIGIAKYFSKNSRAASKNEPVGYRSDDQEWLYQYCEKVSEVKKYDFFVFGHRHLVIDRTLKNGSRYVNIGDWLSFYSYGVFDGERFEVRSFVESNQT